MNNDLQKLNVDTTGTCGSCRSCGRTNQRPQILGKPQSRFSTSSHRSSFTLSKNALRTRKRQPVHQTGATSPIFTGRLLRQPQRVCQVVNSDLSWCGFAMGREIGTGGQCDRAGATGGHAPVPAGGGRDTGTAAGGTACGFSAATTAWRISSDNRSTAGSRATKISTTLGCLRVYKGSSVAGKTENPI